MKRAKTLDPFRQRHVPLPCRAGAPQSDGQCVAGRKKAVRQQCDIAALTAPLFAGSLISEL
jgi:hypothetical protein